MKPNGLLKVTSILHIVFSSIAIVLTLLAATFAGSLVAMLYDMAGVTGGVGAGLLTGSTLFVVSIVGCLLNLVAGILGLKAQFAGCKVLGIILLVLAVISAVTSISTFDSAALIVITAIVQLILPVLYVWGAFKGPAAE